MEFKEPMASCAKDRAQVVSTAVEQWRLVESQENTNLHGFGETIQSVDHSHLSI
jgi:hypothetical protein